MHHFIITGASRGIGEALARNLLDPDHQLYCISRSDNPELKALASAKGVSLEYVRMDLAAAEDIPKVFSTLLRQIAPDTVSSINMIQNAGVLEPVGAIGTVQNEKVIIRNIQVNLLAPILMLETFVKMVADWDTEKRVINISSGAARKPYQAWSNYCTAKAGLDMHSRCLAKEQETATYPVKIVSLAPGVVDTAMQAVIREQPETVFHEVNRFKDLKRNNGLWEPDFAAKEMIKFLRSEKFGEKVIEDLRHLV